MKRTIIEAAPTVRRLTPSETDPCHRRVRWSVIQHGEKVMNTMRRSVSGIALAVGAAALGAAVLTFGGQASVDPAVKVSLATAAKGDRLCGTGHWPPTEAACLQSMTAKSGRSVSVRLVREGATVVERPMTDRERLQAAFAAFETRVALADRR